MEEMETYRLSSKLRENDHEYLILTANDVPSRAVATTIFVDGVCTEETSWPYPSDIPQDQLLSLVKKAHGEKKRELELLLQAYHRVAEEGEPGPIFKLANALHAKQLDAEATSLLRLLLRIDPEHHQGYNLMGQVQLAMGKLDEAVLAATEAVRFRPEYADYRNNLAEAYLARGAVAEASAELEEAIGINLYYADAYVNLALVQTLQASQSRDRDLIDKTVARSRDLLDKAVLIQKEYGHYRDYDEGRRALENHDFSRALGLLNGVKEAIREARRRDTAALLAPLAFDPEAISEESIADHIVSLKEQLQKHPNYLDLQVELARSYLEQARLIWIKGIREFERARECHPSLEGVAVTLEAAETAREGLKNTLATIRRKDQRS
jgi:tetratricopeptide (TPR) repeat protein